MITVLPLQAEEGQAEHERNYLYLLFSANLSTTYFVEICSICRQFLELFMKADAIIKMKLKIYELTASYAKSIEDDRKIDKCLAGTLINALMATLGTTSTQ